MRSDNEKKKTINPKKEIGMEKDVGDRRQRGKGEGRRGDVTLPSSVEKGV